MKNLKIFLIDNDPFFAKNFISKLGSRGSFDIRHFETFEDALPVLNSDEPELVLIEHSLKGTSGLDAIRLIKRTQPELDVVMVSDQNDIQVVESAYEYGVSKYFRKDILLIDHIEGFIRERQSSEIAGWKKIFA